MFIACVPLQCRIIFITPGNRFVFLLLVRIPDKSATVIIVKALKVIYDVIVTHFSLIYVASFYYVS